MITFEQNETVVNVIVNTGTGYSITTKYDCGSKMFATLLYNQLREKYRNEIEAFAKKNYEEGYADKTKRKPKRQWHPSKF